MRYLLCFLFAVLLSACDSPFPAFRGADVSRHDISGNSFSVYIRGENAQAVRTNFAKRLDIRVISLQAEMAIETASGCNLVEIYGDVALLTGVLDCSRPVSKSERAKWVQPPRRGLTCLGESSPSRWGDWRDVTLDCF